MRDVPADADRCPGCGTDLTPLRRVAGLCAHYYNEALRRARSGSLDSALTCASCAVALDRESVAARKLLGKLLWKAGQRRQAIAQWEEAANLEPENEEIPDLLNSARAQLQSLERKTRAGRLGRMAVNAILLFALLGAVWGLVVQHGRLTRLSQQGGPGSEQVGQLATAFDEYKASHSFDNAYVAALKKNLATTQNVPPPERTPSAGLQALVARLQAVEGFEVKHDPSGMQIRFSESLFPMGSDILGDDAKRSLGSLAGAIRESGLPLTVRVEGHTCDVPVSPGSQWADNWSLGLGRAVAAMSELSRHLETDSVCLVACSAGELDPVYPNDSDTNKARNRTVVVHLSFTPQTARR